MAIKFYIDQGHNPQNPNAGAEGNGYREQDLVFQIGIELAEILRAQGYDVRLSRPTADTQLGTSNATSLAARVNDANRWGADYFISLHANASTIETASGSEALVYRLNSVAAELGEDILEGLEEATGLNDRGVVARPNLYVLRRTQMPAVLVELGFITNKRDAELMATRPDLFAQGIANGINEFLDDTTPADVRPNPAPTDGDGLTYAAFLQQNPYQGYLKVQAFRGDQAYPVPGVAVTVSRDFADGRRVFFEGETDENGIIDGIALPAAPRDESLVPDDPVTTAVYDLAARHPLYRSVNVPVEIYEGITAIQPLRLLLKEG